MDKSSVQKNSFSYFVSVRQGGGGQFLNVVSRKAKNEQMLDYQGSHFLHETFS